ncbi:hypothetical protein NDU88_004820 [Pleurodeles waltl]|uniref:Uncharacterized protein n=1 Tax=Pleurodeles waltl TaxID=8319 RepID=A0AAV7M7E2_PLEWA|nr:hypothetical protein NDU88_004820 [Pleurodeles waltl]
MRSPSIFGEAQYLLRSGLSSQVVLQPGGSIGSSSCRSSPRQAMALWVASPASLVSALDANLPGKAWLQDLSAGSTVHTCVASRAKRGRSADQFLDGVGRYWLPKCII